MLGAWRWGWVQSEVHPCSVRSYEGQSFSPLLRSLAYALRGRALPRCWKNWSWRTGAFWQVSRKKLLPFSGICQKIVWRHTKDKVSSGNSQQNFSKDDLCRDQHEPCFEEVPVLAGQGESSECHLV